MASRNRIAANRANAKKSTGPRTEEGKVRSRANSLKHGMSGAGIVLPEEDRARWEGRAETWAEDLGARCELDRYLAGRAALASVRLDRCVRTETATLRQRREYALAAWEHARVRDAGVDALANLLPADPSRAVRGLSRSVLGCEWLIEGWEGLALALAKAGCWDADQVREALDLLGLPGVPTVSHNSAASATWAAAMSVSAYEGFPDSVEEWERFHEVIDPPADPRERHASALARLMDTHEAFMTLARLCDSERERLEALRETLWERNDEPERQQALDRVMIDTTPDGMLRRRYEAASTSELHRAIDQVHRNHRASDREAETDFALDGGGEPDDPGGPFVESSSISEAGVIVGAVEVHPTGDLAIPHASEIVAGEPEGAKRVACETNPTGAISEPEVLEIQRVQSISPDHFAAIEVAPTLVPAATEDVADVIDHPAAPAAPIAAGSILAGTWVAPEMAALVGPTGGIPT